jgi:PAS domain S-box-containing protein
MLAPDAEVESVHSLTDQQYRQLRRGARTYRQELVLKLGAEVGLRPAEMTRITPADVSAQGISGTTHHFLTVPGPEESPDRQAYLPDDVEHDIEQYVRAEDIDADEPLFPVTPRRIQMLISELADRAADRADDQRLADVSSRTLRKFFARTLLESEGVHPKVVQYIGGWDRIESLEPYLEEPDARDVAAAFEGTSLAARGGHEIDDRVFTDVVEQCSHAIYVTDSDGVIEYVNRAFERMTGYSATEAIGERPVMLIAEDEGEGCLSQLRAGETWEGTVRAQRKGGEEYRVHFTVTPTTARDGRELFVAIATESDVAPAPESMRFDAVLDRVRAVGEALSTASMRGEIEQRTCERLAETDTYEFAWAGSRSGEEFNACASAGLDDEALAKLSASTEASAKALESGRVYATNDVTEDPMFESWADHAREVGYDAAAAIPIVDGDTTHGVLYLASTALDAFSERECTMLTDLGERIGQALTAAERRKLLLADTVVELEFKMTGGSSFFVDASAEFDCTLELEGVVPGNGQSLLYFVTLADADAEAVLEWAGDQSGVSDVRLVRDYGDEALLEFVVEDDECSKLVTEQGGDLQTMTASEGVQRFVGVMPSDADVRETVYTLTEAFSGVELVTKRERENRSEQAVASRSSFEDTLTEKQAAVVEAAHHAGYFEWPRGSTAEELADSMGITSPTLHNHLRRGLQKLLIALLDEQDERALDADIPWQND